MQPVRVTVRLTTSLNRLSGAQACAVTERLVSLWHTRREVVGSPAQRVCLGAGANDLREAEVDHLFMLQYFNMLH